MNIPRLARLLSVLTCVALCGCGGKPSRDAGAPDADSAGTYSSDSQTHDPTSSVEPDLAAHVESRLNRNRAAEHDRALDPEKDGWETELISGLAQAQIEQLIAAAIEPTADSREVIDQILSRDFVCVSLDPNLRLPIVTSPHFKFQHTQDTAVSERISAYGVDGLLNAVQRRFAIATPGRVVRCETKTVRIVIEDSTVRTEHKIEAFVQGDNKLREHHWDWQCEWQLDAAARELELRALRTSNYQTVTAATQLYQDKSVQLFNSVGAYDDQLRRGLNFWLERIEVTHGMYLFAEYGIALGDVNGDGFDDVYLCQPAGLPNRMFLWQPDGSLLDSSHASATDWLDHTSSALLVDLDNDGDQDLALAVEAKQVIVMRNDGHGTFAIAASIPIADRHVQGLSAADYDNDGRVDLYLTVGFADGEARSSEERPAFAYHDANEGGANVLLQNVSAADRLSFDDVTAQVGLDVNNRLHSLAASWEDFDNDGDQDLYVANDYGQNCLYENRDGMFHDIAAASGVVDFGSGMSVSWSDFDHDGNMDLYVGNMYSSAGNRITQQDAFQQQVAEEARALLPRFAKGNTLFRNLGNGQFSDVGGALGVEFGRWAWSSVFCDINNDGDDDLLIANGYVTNDDDRDL